MSSRDLESSCFTIFCLVTCERIWELWSWRSNKLSCLGQDEALKNLNTEVTLQVHALSLGSQQFSEEAVNLAVMITLVTAQKMGNLKFFQVSWWLLRRQARWHESRQVTIKKVMWMKDSSTIICYRTFMTRCGVIYRFLVCLKSTIKNSLPLLMYKIIRH